MLTSATEHPPMKATPPPGPTPLPLIGNLPAFFLNPTGYFQRLQRTYCDLVTFYQLSPPGTVLFRPEDVHSVLVEHPAAFLNLPAVVHEDATANEGLLTIDGEKHRQQRRAVQPAFHKKQIANYAAIMNRYTQELLDRWQVGETMNMSQAMRGLTLRIISKCLFSIDVVNQLDLLGEEFTALLGTPLADLDTLFSLRIDHPITAYGKRTQAHHRLDILVDTLIMQRRGDDRDWDDVLSMLLMAPDGERTGLLHNKQIHDHITTFLTAGHETTALALTWTFYLLWRHPHKREKLLHEIRAVLVGRTLTWEEADQLPYTEWVLNESMRLYPPVWFQARYAAEDFELGGSRFPAGTNLLMSQWVTHRRPDIWGDPQVFRPERWDPKSGQTIPSGAFFPFGGGPRTCIGMPFAQFEAKLILTSILQRFLPQAVAGYQPGLHAGLTLRPKHDLYMVLEARPS